MALLNVASAIAIFLLASTYAFLSLLPSPTSVTLLTLSLLFFNNLNIFIAMCEIVLGLNILTIKEDYKRLHAKYAPGNNEWSACVKFLTMPIPLSQLCSGKHTWSKMWSTYSLYDPSYQNHESFGFFIDFGNGLSTIPPSILMNLAMVLDTTRYADSNSWSSTVLSPLFVGCVGLAMYWQVMYGTIIYVLSFMFNRRYEGKSTLEVSLFVGISNSLWFFFPIAGIYSCVCILRDGNMSVFR
ncbi:hypothetical protein ACHAWT_002927 [Skeletonema menzelii]